MAIYSKRATSAQRKALEQYEAISGFEPMEQDDFDAGDISFPELWERNFTYLESILASVSNLDTGQAYEDSENQQGAAGDLYVEGEGRDGS